MNVSKHGLCCIYCQDPLDQSESHIIPESFGRGPTLTQGVCSNCNHEVNRSVEMPLSREFAEIRSFLGLPSKRGFRPLLPVRVEFGSSVLSVNLRSMKHLDGTAYVFKDVKLPNAPERNIAFIGGSDCGRGMA